MGLDMYLSGERYLSQYLDSDKALNEEVSLLSIPPQLGRVKTIKTDAIYWRKANHIHKWFVDNVQGSNDDCHAYEVSVGQLKELLTVVNTVLADRSLAEELLPPQSGFFFGPTEIGDYYWETLEHTKERLESILSAPDVLSWWFEYRSSW